MGNDSAILYLKKFNMIVKKALRMATIVCVKKSYCKGVTVQYTTIKYNIVNCSRVQCNRVQ